MTNLIEEEVKGGGVVHAEIKLPPELQARLDALKPPPGVQASNRVPQ